MLELWIRFYDHILGGPKETQYLERRGTNGLVEYPEDLILVPKFNELDDVKDVDFDGSRMSLNVVL